MLRGEGLSLGERLVDLDVRLEPGHIVAVVGPNGAGKSTLLQVLAGLLPARGRICWQGRELGRIPHLERGRMLAWLGQDSHGDFAFPVREVVAQGRFAWGDDAAGIDEAMAAMDITHLAARPITQLSGGERRRVFLARALATGAPVQLWDEPAASLDVRHALEVNALARGIATRGGLAVVSLHDLRAAYRFDQVLVLDRGRLAGFGPPHEVLTRGLIREVFQVEATFVESLVLELLSP